MVQMMIDGTVGDFRTGTQSGKQIWQVLSMMTRRFSRVTFDTAWSPPEGVIEKLREKFPDVSFPVFL